MKYEDDIHNATPERLAYMLEIFNKWRRGEEPYDEGLAPIPFSPEVIGYIIDEAARRLRELNKPTYENYEQG